MKSPSFDYIKAASVEQALQLLSQHGDDARILAGGQTLLATLNMRLSEPTLLIDIGNLETLRGVERRGDRLHIGALTTHCQIESSLHVAELAPLLSAAVPHIAHRAIRNVGTFGGSLAYADPAAEWPCCLLALDGCVTLQGLRGRRRVAAADFFRDLYTTDMQPDEILVEADIPVASASDWYGFDELARRHGDYAAAGLAVAARFDGTVAQQVRLSFLGVATTPVRARRTETLLAGKPLTSSTIEIALAMLKTELDPLPDLHHESATKRHLATVLARRLLTAAHASRSALSI